MHRVARGAQVDERLDLLGSIGTLSMDGQPIEIDLALVPPVRVELSLKIADAGASVGAAPSSERAAAEAASSSAREEPKVSNLLKMEDVAALMSYDEVVAIKLKLTELVRDGYAKSYALTIIGNIQHTTHTSAHRCAKSYAATATTCINHYSDVPCELKRVSAFLVLLGLVRSSPSPLSLSVSACIAAAGWPCCIGLFVRQQPAMRTERDMRLWPEGRAYVARHVFAVPTGPTSTILSRPK